MCKVSVIMSTYNEPAEYIHWSIQSILSQTLQDFEFIIVLDNPKNWEITKVVNKYKEQDKRIFVITNEYNIGLTKSLNKALKMAKGEYIARMDADDISDAKRLEKQLNYLVERQLDLIGAMMIRMDEEGNPVEGLETRYYSPKVIMRSLRYSDVVPHPTWFVKKEVYTFLNGYREISRCEDYDFLLRALKAGFKIGLCDEVLLKYRINPSGISQTGLLLQNLSANYISSNYNRIEEINDEEIKRVAHRGVTEKDFNKYYRANELFRKAVSYGTDRPISCGFLILKAVVVSPFFIKRIIAMMNIRRVRCFCKDRF